MKNLIIFLIFFEFLSAGESITSTLADSFYEKAEAEFLAKRWENAIVILEKIHPKKNYDSAAWGESTLKMLLKSHLFLASDDRVSFSTKKASLEKSQVLLKELKAHYPTSNVLYDEILLDQLLGNDLLAKSKLLKDSNTLSREDRISLYLLLNEEAPSDLNLLSGMKEEKLLLGLSLYKKGEIQEAEELLKTIYPPPYLLGTIYYNQKKYEEAAKIFHEVAKEDSSKSPSALYFAGRSEEEFAPLSAKSTYEELYTRYKNSTFAPEAYFFSYSMQDYLEGEKTAKKHLEKFQELFPDSPYLILSSYLMGLDALRDRKTEKSKLISKKDLELAIDHFQVAENIYETLNNNEREPWEEIRNLALFEKGKANFEIAMKSRSPKKEIYLAYAIEVFENLPSKKAEFYKGRVLEEMQNLKSAKAIFEKLKVEDDISLKVESLRRLALIAKEEKELKEALDYLNLALLTAKKRKGAIDPDTILEIMIEKSDVLSQKNELDEAMKELTSVINYEAISPFRLKAMFLRARIYELQERRPLARKQLEQLALKGGPWAEKAKLKLEEEYGIN